MGRQISPERLEILHEQHRHIRKKPGPQLVYVDGHEFIQIVAELRARRDNLHKGAPISPITKQLMSMAEGQTIYTKGMSQTALTTLRKTARKHMKNPAAKWRGELQPDGRLKITRQPDNSPVHHGRPRSHVVTALAKMNIDDVIILRDVPGGSVNNNHRAVARTLAGKPHMKWWCEKLSNGAVRARRIR